MAGEQPVDQQFILKCTCEAKSGVVAAVTSFLFERGCYISELAQYDDVDTRRFFMRTVGHIESGQSTLNDLKEQFPEVADAYSMQWELHEAATPTKVRTPAILRCVLMPPTSCSYSSYGTPRTRS